MPNKSKGMYNKNLVIVGIVVFVALAAFPFWYNISKSAPPPEIVLTERAKEAKECVRSKDYMTKEHMQLLDVWRDTVVREAKRIYVNPKGVEFNMSLSNTCLDCHSNKEQFCDRCHDYASVSPYCWECHIDNPQGDRE